MLRENISKSICHKAHLLKVFTIFANHSFQIKQQILATKIILVEKVKVVSKTEELAAHFNNYFTDITSVT